MDVGSDGVSLAPVVVGELGDALSSPDAADDESESNSSVSMLAFLNLRVDDDVAFSAGADVLEPPRQGRQQRNSVELKLWSSVRRLFVLTISIRSPLIMIIRRLA